MFTVNSIFGQYTLNGNASQNDCHCHTLTNDAFNQTGSVWNNNKINLTQSFDFNFDVFLGCAGSDGSGRSAFVLQPNSTSVGTTGNGLGYSGESVSRRYHRHLAKWKLFGGWPRWGSLFDHIAIRLNSDTAFTPNGVGLNDRLKALPVGVKQFKNFTVYNRVGQVVFSTAVYSRGWDGFFKGKAQSPGAYIWVPLQLVIPGMKY